MARTVISATTRPGRVPSKNRWRYPQRTLHLIDIENLVGTGVPDSIQVRELQNRYAMLVGFGSLDQVVVACNHLAIKKTGSWWPGARYLVRSGPDGADLELLDVIFREGVGERFSHVTIASGDGAFAWAASALAASGSQVTVVSRHAGLSRQLALAAGWRVIYIDNPDSTIDRSADLLPDAV